MASRKFFHTLQLCTDFGELSLFDVLEQMDKYVICIILGTAGFKSVKSPLLAQPLPWKT